MAIKCPECHFENRDDSRFCSNCATPLICLKDSAAFPTKTTKKIKKELGIGSIIASKYEICEKLGKGGMGVVYRAKDIKLSRMVAIKLLSPELTDDAQARERFLHEARTASSLDHPNICTIYEIDETEEGQIFIAMAFYEGHTLKEKIKEGPLPVKESIDIALQVAEGLSKAHDKGIIHRDIKPANIIIGADSVVKIVDFGLAKLTGDARLTRTSEIMGTVVYMSLEQASGESVDQRTDIWSLGVVFYESMTGELPFKGENEASMIHSIINKSPIPPTELDMDIPKEADRIIFKCLRKQKEDRYQQASHLLQDLIKLKETLEKKKEETEEKKFVVKRETERRHATIMFVEVPEYKELHEKMDEEEVASTMKSCFELFGQTIRKYGGTIDERMENSIKVLFGIPMAIENAPRKAINAAIEIRNRLQILNSMGDIQIPLNIQIGINTGTVIVGAIGMGGRKDYAVLGDTVTLAAQLKDLAAMGEIYVGESTYRYTKNNFEFEPLKSTLLRGKTTAFPAYVLLSTREIIHRPKLGSERMIHSEMVGRGKELDELKLHILKVINGEGSIVNVIGDPGIGKSRLLAELKKFEDLKKVSLFEGRAVSIGRNLSYHPLIDILKNWASIREDDPETDAILKLEKPIRELYPEGTGELFPFIATLMGMKLTGKHAERVKGIEGEALEKLILKSMRDLMIKAAELRPVVFIVEDFHWADISSVELLESLFRLADDHRVLFINVFRPNYEETSNRILETIKDRYSHIYSNIILKPLDEKQCEALIQNLIKVADVPLNVIEPIINRAEGNPFFIEEVVRSFIDDGVVEIRDGHFIVTEKIDSVVIPETIHEVLMARIDKLDEDSRSLLKMASVIGRNFFYKILADVAKSIEDIDDKLEYLKEGQLILERRRMEEIEYLFKHALVQEATYTSIPIRKRKELHLKIADSIESVFARRLHEFYGMLALHYSQGENLDKAEEYLIRAGQEALKSSASSEALFFYREALKIYMRKYAEEADPEKIAMLEKNIALALFNKGEYIEADEYFSRVLIHYGQKFPKRTIPMIMKFLAGFLSFLAGLYSPRSRGKKIPTEKDREIISLFYKKVTGLVFLSPKRMFIETFYWMKKLIHSDIEQIENGIGILALSGAVFLNAGISYSLCRKVLEFVKDKIDRADVKIMLYYKVTEVLLLTFTGEWDKLGKYDYDLVEYSVRRGELFYPSVYILIFGYAKIEQGNFSGCEELIQILDEIAEAYENDYSRAAYYWFQGQLTMKLRRLQDVQKISEEGISFTRKTGFHPYMFFLYSVKARAEVLEGDLKKAEETLQVLHKLRPDLSLAPYILSTFFLSQLLYDLYSLEETAERGKKPDTRKSRKRAYRAAREAIKYSKKVAADLPESFRLKAVYYWLVGRQKKALAWFDKTIKISEKLGAKLELARTYFEIGKRLQERKSKYHQLNSIRAEEYLEKAKALFQEMGLEWDLREFEKIA